MAASLYLREIRALRAELSLTTASDALRVRTGDAHEPYRALLAGVRDRLSATRAGAEAALASEHPDRASAPAPARYFDAAELLEPLALCYRSLGATGNQLIAAGRLADILRRLAVFGLTLARLDLRQEASRHTDAIEWIAQQRGWGPYAAAAEADRQSLLVRALTAGRTRPAGLPVGPPGGEGRGVPETCMIAAPRRRASRG